MASIAAAPAGLFARRAAFNGLTVRCATFSSRHRPAPLISNFSTRTSSDRRQLAAYAAMCSGLTSTSGGGPPSGMPGMGGGPPGRYLPPKLASGAMGTPWTPMLGDTSTVCPRVNGCRTFRCFWFLGRGHQRLVKKINAHHTSLDSALKGHGGRRAPAMRRLP